MGVGNLVDGRPRMTRRGVVQPGWQTCSGAGAPLLKSLRSGMVASLRFRIVWGYEFATADYHGSYLAADAFADAGFSPTSPGRVSQ